MNPFTCARWIWPSGLSGYLQDARAHFRRVFTLDAVPDPFPAVLTADSAYTLWVNGRFVHHGPARGVQAHWPFDRIDLAPYLRPGKNVIAVRCYQFGISNYTYRCEWCNGLIFEAPGIATGAAWKMRIAPGYDRAVARCANQYAFQEFCDCGAAEDGWREADYDDSAWETPVALRVPGCAPWFEFEERGIPLFPDVIAFGTPVAGRFQAETLSPLRRENIGDAWRGCRFTPLADGGETLDPGTMEIRDFGIEQMGLLEFSWEAEAETTLDFLTVEYLKNGLPEYNPDNLPLYGGRLTLPSGKGRHTLTLPWGFRYAALLNRGPGVCQIELQVRQLLYPLEITGELDCDDRVLNAVRTVAVDTQKRCMTDVYLDGPWRENAQWWGDALVQAANTFALSPDCRLLERGIRLMAAERTPDGMIYGVAPASAPHCILPDYSAIWLVSLYEAYFQTGSLALYRELASVGDAMLAYWESAAAKGPLTADPRYLLYIDVAKGLDKNEPYHLLVMLGVRRFGELAEAAGDAARAARCKALFAALKANALQRPVGPHAAAMAVLAGAAPERNAEFRDAILRPLLLGEYSGVIPNLYFMFYVFSAADQLGLQMEILQAIHRDWGAIAAAGYRTFPEYRTEQLIPFHSRCHAWSAHPAAFLPRILLGIRPAAPGWKQVTFEPLPLPGKRITGTVPTPQGAITVTCDWRDPAAPQLDAALPPGIALAEL